MGVRCITIRHLLNRIREHLRRSENPCVLSVEAEYQSDKEAIHLVTKIPLLPLWILTKKLKVETIESTNRLDVESVLSNRPHGCDARKRKEKAEVVGELRVFTGDRLAGRQMLGLEHLAVRRDNERTLMLRRCRRKLELHETRRHLARLRHQDVNVVALEHTALDIRLVRRTRAQL